MNNKKQKGFTLIELMIVIAIIAILMSYAIPAYRDYTVRTKVGEGLSVSAGVRSLISEAWVASEDLATYSSGSNGVPPAVAITGSYVGQVAVAGGTITVTYANDPDITGQTLTLTPLPPGVGGNGGTSLLWDCTSNLDNRYLPSGCRTP